MAKSKNLRIRDVLFYKFIVIAEFTFLFLFMIYAGDLYTTLKDWLRPPIEHRVEITSVSGDTRDVVLAKLRSLKGHELIVYRDGIIVYVPLVTKRRVLVRYPAGTITEIVERNLLEHSDIALVVSPEDHSRYMLWLTRYKLHGKSVLH